MRKIVRFELSQIPENFDQVNNRLHIYLLIYWKVTLEEVRLDTGASLEFQIDAESEPQLDGAIFRLSFLLETNLVGLLNKFTIDNPLLFWDRKCLT